MIFRPYPVLSVLIVPAIGFLLLLGTWQVQRMGWKQDELAAYAQARETPAADLNDALCVDEPMRGRPVRFAPDAAGREVRLQGVDADNAPGWRVFSPARAPDCLEAEFILVERYFQPLRESENRRPVFVDDWRVDAPPLPGVFTPPGDARSGEFYAYDRDAVSQALDMDPARLSGAWWLSADDGQPPAHLAQTPPERHFAYALTWFLMAVALAGVYLAFHATNGRLRLRG